MLDLARPDDRAQVAAVLTDAFAEDPLTSFMFAHPVRGEVQRQRMMEISAERGIALGHTYVWRSSADRADDHDRVIDGVALWAPPGQSFFGAAEGRQIGDLLTGADATRLPLLSAGMSEVHAHEPQEPHFHLQFCGVRSALRGQGIGAKLLRGSLELIDRLGYLAFLESSNARNVSLYQREGFDVQAEVEIPEGPIIRPMLRHRAH
ncbi:MAG: GNAT family N-acetyltransferase [Actinomycetota bacterium]|nr:GNAT family N-acetyltransferase [Actinomycetota bacterium]